MRAFEASSPGRRNGAEGCPAAERCRVILSRLRSARIHDGGRHLLVLAVYLALAVGLFWSAWRSPQTMAVGGGADAPYTMWFMRWVAFALTHGQNPLLSDYIDYPGGVNLMWNGLFPLPAILLSPITVGLGPVLARNLLLTLALGASSFTAFLACSRYVAHRGGAFLGGLLYGFSPFMIAHSLGHVHLTIAFVPPLLLLGLDEALVRQRRPWVAAGLLLGLLAALQFWIGEELLATEALVAVVGIAILIALHPAALRAKAPYAVRALLAAGVTALVLSAFPLAVQFLGPQRVSGTLQPLNIYASDLLNFVLPTRMQAFAPPAALQVTDQLTGNLTEWDAYLGLPLIVLLIVSVVRAWRSSMVIRLCALTGLSVAILSMGITVHLGGTMSSLPVPMLALALPRVRHGVPGRTMLFTITAGWAALALLPVVHNILPNRLMLYVFLFAAIVLAAFVAEVARAAPRLRLLGALAVALALVPLAPILPFPASEMRAPAYFTAGASNLPAGSTALVAPYARGGAADAMFWQVQAGMRFRMPEGYAFVPGPSLSPPHTVLGDRMIEIENVGGAAVDPAQRQAMLADLARWKVETVIVGPMPHQPQMVAFFTDLLGRGPVERDGVYLFEGVAP